MRLDRVFRIYFILCVFVLGGVYGFFVHRNQVFPYTTVTEAGLAFAAWAEVADQAHPGSFRFIDESATAGPVTQTVDAGRGDELILITGGPFEFLSECPRFGCLAWIVDREGTVVHSWEVDLEDLWAGADHLQGRTNPMFYKPVGMHLLPDGSLIMAFMNSQAFPYGAGLARVDRDGNVVWRRHDHSHHWFTVDEAGTIYTPAHYWVEPPVRIGDTYATVPCEGGRTLIDTIQVIDADGELVEVIPLFDMLVDQGYGALAHGTQESCDLLHLNHVEVVGAEGAAQVDGLAAGDLIFSLRNVNAVGAIDRSRQRISWLISGQTTRQHGPRLLDDGRMLIFDNMGGPLDIGGSAIVEARFGSQGADMVFPRRPGPTEVPFLSSYGGQIDPHPGEQRALVALTEQGAIKEVDLISGQVTWEYVKTFPGTGYPGIAPDDQDQVFVRVEAFGAYYVAPDAFPFRESEPAEER